MLAKALPLCLLGAIFAACTAEKEQTSGDALVPIILTTAVQGERGASTRTTDLTIQSAQLEAGQTFSVYFPGGATTESQVTYEAVGDGTTAIADGSSQPYFTLAGTSTTAYAYYPSTVGTSSTEFSVEREQQNADDYRKSDLMFASTTLSKRGTSVSGLLSFRHLMSKIVVNVSGSAKIQRINDVNIVGGYARIGITDPLTCTFGSLSRLNKDENGARINLVSNNTTNSVSCTALIPPQTVNGQFLRVRVVVRNATINPVQEAFFSVTDKTFLSGGTYTYNIKIDATDIGLTTEVTDWSEEMNLPTVNNGGDIIMPNNLRAVDLGLSVKWSNLNVGAETETDFGGYFSWGETMSKNNYAKAAYAFWDGANYTKYTSTDGLTVLEEADDAATVNWGRPWRMPTQAEINELGGTFSTDAGDATKTHYWKWYDGSTEKYNGSSNPGWLVTCKANANSIFLPKGGYYQDTTPKTGNGCWCNFWSSTRHLYQTHAYYLMITNTAPGSGSHYERQYGFSIRGVQ